MTQSPNSVISPDWLLEWLKNGAFCQLPAVLSGASPHEGAVYLFLGPFESCPSTSTGHMSTQDFFGSPQSLRAQDAKTHIITAERLFTLLKETLTNLPFSDKESLTREDFELPDQESYKDVFLSIQSEISKGHLKKAVPVAVSRAQKTPSLRQRADWILRLLQSPKNMHPYGMWDGVQGILGLTPELLFCKNGLQVQTAAVAGTLSKTSSQTMEEFFSDPKERAEHHFVVQDLLQQLRPFGEVTLGETLVREYPTLYHLVTPIQLSLNNTEFTVADLIKSLHPTSALGVFPRDVGLSFLESLPEQKWRWKHGSPLAFHLSKEESLVLVAIRCLQWKEQGSFIVSGGGIVGESDLEKEWREILHKRNAVFNFLGMKDEQSPHPLPYERLF